MIPAVTFQTPATAADSELRGEATLGGRTIAGNALIGYAGSIGLTALAFAAKVVLIRILAPADFGRVIITQNLIAIFLVVSGLGITDAVVRFVGVHARVDPSRAKGVVLNACWFVMLSGMASTVLLLVCARPVASWFGLDAQGWFGVALAALAIVPSLLGDVIGAGFRGLNRLWVKVVVLDLGRALSTLAGYLLLASTGWATYTGAVSVQVSAALVSSAIMIVVARRGRSFSQTAHPAELTELLAYSVPLFVSGLIGGTLVGSGVPLVLAAQSAPELVGFYAMVLTIQPLLQLPAIAIENAALPMWAAASRTDRDPQLALSFAHVTRWAMILGLLVYVPLTIVPRECLQLLFGNRQLGSMPVVEVALAATFFSVAVGPNEGMLRALGSTRAIVVARLVAGAVAFSAAWPLIRVWGVTGAIVAWAANGVISNAVYGFYLARLHGIQPVNSRYCRTLVVGIIGWLISAAVAAAGSHGYTKLIAVVITNTVVFGIASFLFGVWHPAELNSLLQRSRSR